MSHIRLALSSGKRGQAVQALSWCGGDLNAGGDLCLVLRVYKLSHCPASHLARENVLHGGDVSIA